ncbi:hypothetical protein [Wenxinia marina]|uniref:Uncharacterized protein n=1 Tax=Wenxinia marina DSM 24838 TaxID=1123501 RepID=A0A0D0NHR7_9RHOB|nr:hypothetical protein [Wenxinia marina]KIQ67895.1 hypothetical protein Wenmar_03625 [Wenxinia marina DSM 24838]GGL74283.1 hypothetical protein GCM10011392_31020 [Wenxinia marina]
MTTQWHGSRTDRWVAATQIVANLGVIAALVLAGLTLEQDRRFVRGAASDELVATFHGDRLAEARGILFELWAGRDLSALAQTDLPRSTVDALVSRMIRTATVDRTAVLRAIADIASFFDGLEACLASGRCDDVELSRRLGGYALDFECIYRGQIEEMRTRMLLADLGRGLQEFAAIQGSCDRLPPPEDVSSPGADASAAAGLGGEVPGGTTTGINAAPAVPEPPATE